MEESLMGRTKMAQGSESMNPIFSVVLIDWIESTFLLNTLELGLDEITDISLLYALFEHSDKYILTGYFSVFKALSPKKVTLLLKGFLEKPETKPIELEKKDRHKINELDKYTVDLTQSAKEGKIDPVLSRENEIKQAIDILSRRRKNNPILVGEAGVGKTAVVEGLALKIVNKEVPKHLYDAKLLSLDLGAMQAGASVKGEFERRLQAVINEIKSSEVFTVLFIDEAHTLIGAGGNEGGSDAANLLKPALARGELKTIAATTWLEYRKYFEKDPALSRRFQKIDLVEPSIEQTITILRGIANKYEEVHDVYIEDDALQAAAKLSARYITGRKLPDKAIDVLDTACANVKIGKSNEPFVLLSYKNDINVLEKKLKALQRDSDESIKDNKKEIVQVKKEIAQLKVILKKETALWKEQAKKLKEIKTFKKNGDKKVLKKVQKEFSKLQEKSTYIYETVNEEQIAEVISSWTGIPLGSMKEEQVKNILTFSEQIKQCVIGQDEAVDYLSTFLQISTAGLKKENTPEGVFLLVGPSGVGKTETAIKIAEILFGGKQFLTIINMTEFQEKHTISRLIGSPPGYVGYGEGGQLTDPVRIKPYSVVLFDEIEKAHPDILNLFYQIFDKGVANDGEGREICFRNTVIIMTSNLATDEITELFRQDETVKMDEVTTKILPILSTYFKPALLGRMNVIPYTNLDVESLKKIATLKLATIEKQLALKNIIFTYDNRLLEYIVECSDSIETGARNIELIINHQLMPKLSKIILDDMLIEKKLQSISVTIDGKNSIEIQST
ncbi:MAG: type VI secretion system ATPase TssH [Sulfurovum sp.]|nr:type VI secretion system ATPase TssH [Sulfurovum sp.]